MAGGDKVKERIKAVPENIKKAVDDVINKSVAEAVDQVPKRFGEANRNMLLK